MAQRKVSVLDKAVEEVAHVGYFIESKGMPETAKRFIDDCFSFFTKLGDDNKKYKPCSYKAWRELGYRCASFRKKYVVAYLDVEDEVIVCDFAPHKLVIDL